MAGELVGAFIGLAGVVIGSGIPMLQARAARKAEARSVLQAFVADVDALTRLARHRQYREGIIDHAKRCSALVDAGRGSEPGPGLSVTASFTPFATYEALNQKIGLLDAYYADQITRFYAYARSLMDDFLPDGAINSGQPAAVMVEMYANDLMLLDSVLTLGDHIGKFRTARAPKGLPPPVHATEQAVGSAQQSGEV